MTSATRLRRAAQLARETAEAAYVQPAWYTADELPLVSDHNIDRDDATHIALWSPPVALAVAAWLEAAGGWAEVLEDLEIKQALAVADALLSAAGEKVKP